MVTVYDGRTSAVAVASHVAVVLAPAVADSALGLVTVAEYDAGTAIQCAIREVAVTGTAATRREQRLCAADVSEFGGPITWSVSPLVIQSGDPQAPNALLDGLVRGEVRYLLQRLGLPHDATAAAGQRIRVAEVEVVLVEDMPLVASPDGTKFETRIHLAVRQFRRDAILT